MRLGDYIGDAIEQIEERLEQAEELISETRSIALSSPFSALRRRSARIRRYLGPQREALDRLLSCPDELLTPDNKADLHEQVNRLTLILEDLDLVRERAMVAQEEFLGIVAHEQNSRMLVLSIVAAIFLPLSFLTGLMGMNVAGLPGTENENAFLITLALMLVASAGIILLFRFKRWF
jgi:zinc transporter